MARILRSDLDIMCFVHYFMCEVRRRDLTKPERFLPVLLKRSHTIRNCVRIDEGVRQNIGALKIRNSNAHLTIWSLGEVCLGSLCIRESKGGECLSNAASADVRQALTVFESYNYYTTSFILIFEIVNLFPVV